MIRKRIALAQTQISWENKEENIEKAKEIIYQESRDGTDILLFPEMSFTGFSMNVNATKENNQTVELFRGLAKKFNMNIGVGWVKETGSKCENHYTIVGRTANIISDYVKIHPFSYSSENIYFVGGDRLSFFFIEDLPVASFICYDVRFPEIFRMVSDRVHAVIIPANWPSNRSEHWKTLLRARAIENQVYIFAINCVGDIGDQYYSGDSCVINPNGDVIAMLSGAEGVLIHNFVDDVDVYRKNFPVLQDRRYDIYGQF